MIWYKFTPCDTIFFRGAEPMLMGDSHSSNVNFPLPLSTISGAVRTAVLKQNNISIEDYYNNKADEKIINVIGKAEDKENFVLSGPLFSIENDIYIPAPFIWYNEKKNHNGKVYQSTKINSDLIKTQEELYWVKEAQSEVETLGGNWLNLKDFLENKKEIEVKNITDFYDIENRTGIALNTKVRMARKGHIYSFDHIRLKRDVSIVFGMDKEILNETGELKLGAEQRFGNYKKIEESISFDKKNTSEFFMSLSIIEGSKEANENIVAAGKIIYLGGWDLKKGFHKPMRGYYPAGSVFKKKINDNFIEI